MKTAAIDDEVIYRADGMQRLGVRSETIRRYLKAKKLPPPDVALSAKKVGWRLSTLRAAGVNLAGGAA